MRRIRMSIAVSNAGFREAVLALLWFGGVHEAACGTGACDNMMLLNWILHCNKEKY